MPTILNALARAYHRDLPGIIRATLNDSGISDEVINHRMLGWDGEHITVPVWNRAGSRVAFMEHWHADRVGKPANEVSPIELYPWPLLDPIPNRVYIAEGTHEALILESQGFAAVTATGTGRVFKTRDWGPVLGRVKRVVLAYPAGEQPARRKDELSRSKVIELAKRSLPHAKHLQWPSESAGSAFSYFVKAKHDRSDFKQLPLV